MSLYGDYQPDSNGWDDGFETMKDSGEDSSSYLTTYAEPDEDTWDTDEDAWIDSDEDASDHFDE